MSDLANITVKEAANETWDAIVIGAGPAGALAARQLAGGLDSGKARVLLVERKSFPRYKVCGACVNQRALNTLRLSGLQDVVERLPTRPLHRLRMYHGRLRSDLALDGGVAVSRSAMDLELVRQAIADGVCFLDETTATVQPHVTDSTNGDPNQDYRYVELQSVEPNEIDGAPDPIAEGRVVLAADGLAGSCLRHCDNAQLQTNVTDDSRVGFGGVVDDASCRFHPYTIHMAIHRRGYVGLVHVENNRLNIAGAADRDFLRECGGPAACANEIMGDTTLPRLHSTAAAGELATWTGTAALTRHRTRAADHRLLLLGDANGYVEPFTGEGIAWALTSAYQAAPIALNGIRNWTPSLERQWQQLRDAHATRHQRTCRAVARLLRHPTLVRLSMHAVTTFPALTNPLLSRINATAVS